MRGKKIIPGLHEDFLHNLRFFLGAAAVQMITNHHHKMQMRHIKPDLCEIQAC